MGSETAAAPLDGSLLALPSNHAATPTRSTRASCEDWELQDPAGQPVEMVRRIRDNIDARVQQLLNKFLSASA
jgi:protein-tyrosine-phosphatase